MPEAASSPVPTPKYTMFEMALDGGLNLQPSFALLASTQNADSFNIFAEGLEWKYPATLPSSCCNYKQEKALTGLGVISVANANLDGSGTIVDILKVTGGVNGGYIKAITIKAQQSTKEGVVRFFISNDGGHTYNLIEEVWVPQSVQSSEEPSFKRILFMNLNLEADAIIGVSTDTAQSFGISIEGNTWSYPIS